MEKASESLCVLVNYDRGAILQLKTKTISDTEL